jgi:hypothetical protein
VPAFFIPTVDDPAKAEAAYAEFANEVGASVPPLAERILSITFSKDGAEYVATVGERLRGTRSISKKRRGKTFTETREAEDFAVVLAIFDGTPFYVWTDGGKAEDRPSGWANPFMVGPEDIRRIIRFSA